VHRCSQGEVGRGRCRPCAYPCQQAGRDTRWHCVIIYCSWQGRRTTSQCSPCSPCSAHAPPTLGDGAAPLGSKLRSSASTRQRSSSCASSWRPRDTSRRAAGGRQRTSALGSSTRPPPPTAPLLPPARARMPASCASSWQATQLAQPPPAATGHWWLWARARHKLPSTGMCARHCSTALRKQLFCRFSSPQPTGCSCCQHAQSLGSGRLPCTTCN
jgi:hypothetical protein